MKQRIHPLLWPILVPASPALALFLAMKSKRFDREVPRAAEENRRRIDQATPLELPELEYLKLSVVVDFRAAVGFQGDPGVSYLIETDRGRVLFDVGFGPADTVFAHNWRKLGFSLNGIDAVVISHLHIDHMGGLAASKKNQVMVPVDLAPAGSVDCYVPDECISPYFNIKKVEHPQLLPAGLATTGPLARMLYFLGYTREQSLIANVKGKGLVVIIGCGHPSLAAILPMAQKQCAAPLHAVIGGLHFPVTDSPNKRFGIQLQRILGTGKRWNKTITDEDLTAAIQYLQEAHPARLLLSPHDSCEHSLERFQNEVGAEFEVLTAGMSYSFGPA